MSSFHRQLNLQITNLFDLNSHWSKISSCWIKMVREKYWFRWGLHFQHLLAMSWSCERSWNEEKEWDPVNRKIRCVWYGMVYVYVLSSNNKYVLIHDRATYFSRKPVIWTKISWNPSNGRKKTHQAAQNPFVWRKNKQMLEKMAMIR